MKKVFDKLCIPLMLINDNVYTFISGILLSLSTGIITTFCLDKTPFSESWHLYTASLVYTIAGAMLIYVTSQVSSYQNYISSKKIINPIDKKSIIKDHEFYRCNFWVIFFLILCLCVIAGTVLMFLNYAF